MKSKAIALEADKTAMKGQVAVIADAIAACDKKAAAALVEKRELWSTISVSTLPHLRRETRFSIKLRYDWFALGGKGNLAR